MMLGKVIIILLIAKLSTSDETNSQHLKDIVNCGGNYSGYKYIITSPDYPKKYPEAVECIYILKGSPQANCNQIFNLQFLDFSLVPSEDCRGDFLEIGDRSVFCGKVEGVRRYPSINDNTLTIRFHSSKSTNGGVGGGFKIEVTTSPCPSVALNSTSSQLLSAALGVDKPEVGLLTEAVEDDQVAYNNPYPLYRPPSPFIIEDSESAAYQALNTTSLPKSSLPALHSSTPSAINSTKTLTKISAYFFAPPNSDTSVSPVRLSPNLSAISSLPSEQLPPTKDQIAFRSSDPSADELSKLSELKDLAEAEDVTVRDNGKVGSYDPPAVEPLDVIKKGEVLENTNTLASVGKANIDKASGSNYAVSLYRLANSYPAATYGQPGLQYPSLEGGFLPPQNRANYLPPCCSTAYSAPRFLLSSPGFPSVIYSSDHYECRYTITPSGPNVCRLQFNLKFFNLGSEDSFCSAGFLEVDGRRYCGCKSGVSIISNVPNFFAKSITVRYVGLPRTKKNGFLIEVVQQSCSYNEYPYSYRGKRDIGNVTLIEGDSDDKQSRAKRNLGYSYPKPSNPFDPVTDVKSLGTSSFLQCYGLGYAKWILAAKEVFLQNARCIAVPSYPSYPGKIFNYPGNNRPNGPNPYNPGYNGSPPSTYIPQHTVPQSPEHNGFHPIPNIPQNIVPNCPGGANQPGPGIPYPEVPPPTYLPPSNPIPQACETIPVIQGTISSPFYPSPYPNNINKCWRFYKLPTACELKLSFLNFDVEPSHGCVKDYLTITGQNTRYCGRTLSGSNTFVGFPPNDVIDIRFISDNFGSGKGFYVAYSQILCQVEANR